MGAPVDRRHQDVVLRLGGLGDQRLDLAEPGGVAPRVAGHVHHHQEPPALAVQRQHLELVGRGQDAGPHHGLADHHVEHFPAGKLVGPRGGRRKVVHLGRVDPAITATHQGTGFITQHHTMGFTGGSQRRLPPSKKPSEHIHGLQSLGNSGEQHIRANAIIEEDQPAQASKKKHVETFLGPVHHPQHMRLAQHQTLWGPWRRPYRRTPWSRLCRATGAPPSRSRRGYGKSAGGCFILLCGCNPPAPVGHPLGQHPSHRQGEGQGNSRLAVGQLGEAQRGQAP